MVDVDEAFAQFSIRRTNVEIANATYAERGADEDKEKRTAKPRSSDDARCSPQGLPAAFERLAWETIRMRKELSQAQLLLAQSEDSLGL